VVCKAIVRLVAVVIGVAVSAACPHGGYAADIVGIIEDISGPGAGVAAFDQLHEGERIELPAGTALTLGYFASCTRETIKGGRVVVGREQSTITGGAVRREVLKCPQPANLDIAAAPAPKLKFRGAAKADPSLVIFYTSPVIVLRNPGEVVIERLDHEETARVFAVDKVLDLAKQQVFLSAGGIYRISVGGAELMFRVSPEAIQGGGPLLARLLRL